MAGEAFGGLQLICGDIRAIFLLMCVVVRWCSFWQLSGFIPVTLSYD